MRKVHKIVLIVCFIFIFSVSHVFATNIDKKQLIRKVEIASLEIPELNKKIDKDVIIKRTNEISVSEIVWYKNGSTMLSEEIDEPGTYTCRIYLIVDDGYMVTSQTEFMTEKGKVQYAEMNGKPFINISFTVKEPSVSYPTKIRVGDLTVPRANIKPDYNLTSDNATYYTIDKIEWYTEDDSLMNTSDVFTGGTYKCRVYLNLINGFEVHEGIVARIGSIDGKIVQNIKEVYIEAEYYVQPLNDEKCLTLTRIIFEKMPSFGINKKDISIEQEKSNYYKIDQIVWYKDLGIMYEENFSAGNYKCRVYFEFINGGYPSKTLKVYTGESFLPKAISSINGRYYVERNFTINQPYITTFKFTDLNLPEFGGIQDNKLTSLEPGMYTPSMVYWYKDNKFMSNVETYTEGVYKCKFTLTVNPECIINEDANANINGMIGTVSKEYNTITVEMNYEVKRPSKTWTNASEWSKVELEEALNNALIPTMLNNKDYTQSITRAEFAAVAVKLYERITYRIANPVESNPFSDTKDNEVLKAYALGITNGTSETTFEPNSLITRQEMATMMVRAIAKAGKNTNVNLDNISKFSDHDKIDSWALNGVYFMSNIGIIKGVGNNTFNVTGNATREEALAISIRSVEKFK